MAQRGVGGSRATTTLKLRIALGFFIVGERTDRFFSLNINVVTSYNER